jgi:hypothetical protein
MVVVAPTLIAVSPAVIRFSGSRVMSTRRSGEMIPSLSIRSSWVVPPAR